MKLSSMIVALEKAPALRAIVASFTDVVCSREPMHFSSGVDPYFPQFRFRLTPKDLAWEQAQNAAALPSVPVIDRLSKFSLVPQLPQDAGNILPPFFRRPGIRCLLEQNFLDIPFRASCGGKSGR